MNRLAQETSPYLLQHANNPVDWYPWGEEAFQKAKDENKLLIISIGYSACHWCHVMEHESFEDEQIAKLMNAFYVCVKVDREERPDVDALYMDAANIMIGRGGWPLNAFAMPDGRPVYAGTYFPKAQWSGLLREIAGGYRRGPDKYIAYAEKLIKGIEGLSTIVQPQEETKFNLDELKSAFWGFTQHFDRTNGGRGRAPKFPMPDNYLFLLRYAHATGDKDALNQVYLTLDKMAKGGIYDQIGGGFARYSTDAVWLVPHFEKMLYDNAQLVSLYAEAWQVSKNPLYKVIVYQTIAFVKRELTSPEGAFYSALDADSEGEEGKFYVWKAEEFERFVGNENADLLKEYFGIGEAGFWEHENNILIQAKPIAELAVKYSLSEDETNKIIKEASEKLLAAREKRIRPGLDNKILLSWNMLMLKGLLDAYKVFDEPEFLQMAEKAFGYLQQTLLKEAQLYRTVKNGAPAIPAFLEDYALYIQFVLQWYQHSFDEKHLLEAKKLTEFVIAEFSDEKSGMFYFTSKASKDLAARKIETTDNVIASPNSIMAHNLFVLGLYFGDETHINRSEKMLAAVMPQITEYAPFYSNWTTLLCYKATPFYEVAIVGKNALEQKHLLERTYMPNKILAGSSDGNSTLPLLQNRFIEGKTMIYVCQNRTCNLPVENAAQALEQMQ
ncbi:MAG: thioredoxin domain-containing protein [Bacteroidia bacterium]